MSPARFAQLMSGDPNSVPLDEAALAIAASLRADLDEIEQLAALDLLAGECPTPTPEGIARYLFGADGFHGNHAAYYDWRNSCLDQVLLHRRGIPITLALVMIEVGRRLGVSLVGVGMPAHFLVGVADDTDRFFDPFHGGVELDRAAARKLFERITEGRAPWDEGHLEPTPNRQIVIRMLNNLKLVFARRNDAVRLAIVMRLRTVLPELVVADGGEIDRAIAALN